MLPESFKERMRELLGEEYPLFISALSLGEAVRGARVNLIKCPSGDVPMAFADGAVPIPYLENGYILNTEKQIGKTPEHHAGMIYMQDPGAMSALSALDITPDMWVADLCSAPGGKATQAAERLGEGGFLLANEYVPKRAKILVANLERLGVRSAIVTSLDTAALSKLYSAVFDLVILDAPCSGEGMFRKTPEAINEWSEGAVLASARRQQELIENAYNMLRPGGYLLYSTCTFSIEENEAQIHEFLSRHSDMELYPVRRELQECTADGIAYLGDERLKLARRFYPHISPGEGQFVALLRRGYSDTVPTFLYKDSSTELKGEMFRTVKAELSAMLSEIPSGRFALSGDNIVLISHGCPIPPRSVFMSGVLVGELRRGVLHPSHQFFSAYGEYFKGKVMLGEDDERVKKYLAGEEIECDPSLSGFVSVMYCGVPLGGGKAVQGRLKNHYPKGLRTPI